MIVKLFNNPHIVYQIPDSEGDFPNDALAVYVDNGDAIVIQQNAECICLNKATVHELCKLLKTLST